MSKIKVMSTALSNRIAAGEVIERPASVVKELVENSLDAKATRIGVAIERSGSRLIRVVDDGCGMDNEDALLALESHGTSKLICDEDIENISTLGFRGEALPSIASISHFLLRTRSVDLPEGCCVSCHGGGEIEVTPCGGPTGTTIEVRDLFYNLPARKKFLKSPATEEHHIEDVVDMLAISHWQVGFSLKINGREVLNSPGASTPEQRIREVMGRNFADNMLDIDHKEGEMRVFGWIASPGFYRASRRDQRVFINTRPVEAQAVYRGIRDGYATLSDAGHYPPVILFIEMPYKELDVNVHPAKREVRFKSDYAVSRMIASAVSNGLRKLRNPVTSAISDNSLPLSGKVPLSLVLEGASVEYHPVATEQMKFTESEKESCKNEKINYSNWSGNNVEVNLCGSQVQNEQSALKVTTPLRVLPQIEEIEFEVAESTEKTEFSANETVIKTGFKGDWPQEILAVLDDTYLLCSGKSGLILVDQHAAHERICFEALLAEAQRSQVVRQPLLIPQTLELPRVKAALLLSNRHIFDELGFEVESAGGGTILVSSVPLQLRDCRPLEDFFPEMLDELLDNASKHIAAAPELVARAACRAAIKAHDHLPISELQVMLEELRRCRQGTLCPHGRPTMVTITYRELEKRFARR